MQSNYDAIVFKFVSKNGDKKTFNKFVSDAFTYENIQIIDDDYIAVDGFLSDVEDFKVWDTEGPKEEYINLEVFKFSNLCKDKAILKQEKIIDVFAVNLRQIRSDIMTEDEERNQYPFSSQKPNFYKRLNSSLVVGFQELKSLPHEWIQDVYKNYGKIVDIHVGGVIFDPNEEEIMYEHQQIDFYLYENNKISFYTFTSIIYPSDDDSDDIFGLNQISIRIPQTEVYKYAGFSKDERNSLLSVMSEFIEDGRC